MLRPTRRAFITATIAGTLGLLAHHTRTRTRHTYGSYLKGYR